MTVTWKERERILDSTEFIETLADWQELSNMLSMARSQISKLDSAVADKMLSAEEAERQRLRVETEIHQLQEAALCAYLRPRHAMRARYVELAEQLKRDSGMSELFSFQGVSFLEPLISICWSHNEDPAVLAEVKGPYEDTFPRDLTICGEVLNTQFCAALLRLADIMDFDRERTPRVLFEALGIASRSVPSAEVTLREWSKHLSVHTIETRDDEILISAVCEHPVIECAVREFCRSIERELRDTAAVLKRNPAHIAARYALNLPVTVRPRIQPQGYVYKEMAFKLNQSALMSLLMGERLYTNPAVPVRELLQNALDACAVRQSIESGYTPSIRVTSEWQDDGLWIHVADDGIGMDEHVLMEYFFNVGTSYYASHEFHRLMRSASRGSYVPISRFGIGIISVFMIADLLRVVTCNKKSPRLDFKSRTLTLDSRGGLAFVTERPDGSQGTTVGIRLKREFANGVFLTAVLRYVQQTVIRPAFPITVQLEKHTYVIGTKEPLRFADTAADYLKSIGVEAILLDLGRWSDQLRGEAVLFFFKQEDGKLSYTNTAGVTLKFKRNLDPAKVIAGFAGNRVTVNGFVMSLKRASKILEIGRAIAVAHDFDVKGDDSVVYNVSRDKITGLGATNVREHFRMTVTSGIKDIGIWDRLTPETKMLFSTPRSDHTKKTRDIDEHTLKRVEELLPRDRWPTGLHKTIGDSLGLSHGLVSSAINLLLATNRVKNPNLSDKALNPLPDDCASRQTTSGGRNSGSVIGG